MHIISILTTLSLSSNSTTLNNRNIRYPTDSHNSPSISFDLNSVNEHFTHFSLVVGLPHPQLSSLFFFHHEFPGRGITLPQVTLQSKEIQLSSLGKIVSIIPLLLIAVHHCKRNCKKSNENQQSGYFSWVKIKSQGV